MSGASFKKREPTEQMALSIRSLVVADWSINRLTYMGTPPVTVYRKSRSSDEYWGLCSWSICFNVSVRNGLRMILCVIRPNNGSLLFSKIRFIIEYMEPHTMKLIFDRWWYMSHRYCNLLKKSELTYSSSWNSSITSVSCSFSAYWNSCSISSWSFRLCPTTRMSVCRSMDCWNIWLSTPSLVRLAKR